MMPVGGLSRWCKSWLDAGLGFFYPPACQVCGRHRAGPEEGFVCTSCWQNVRFISRPFCERCGLPFEGAITTSFRCGNCHDVELYFSAARSAVAARGMVLDVIHRYKYRRALWFGPFLGDLLVRQAAPQLRGEAWDFIVPVPLHAMKRREREFNQSDELAAHLSRATGIPVQRHLLVRAAPTRTQALLSREERTENVRRAFALRRPGSLKGRKIVVVDDVLTTGATTNACARVLRGAGAEQVCVWTLARGL